MRSQKCRVQAATGRPAPGLPGIEWSYPLAVLAPPDAAVARSEDPDVFETLWAGICSVNFKYAHRQQDLAPVAAGAPTELGVVLLAGFMPRPGALLPLLSAGAAPLQLE